MSVYPSKSHLHKLKASQQALKLESVRIQHQFLDVLCNRHRVWAKDATNPEAAQTHARIAELVQEAAIQIEHILDLYRQDDHQV